MATTYTSTIQVKCWKAHTCVVCETIYAYLFTRQVKGTGGDNATASANARRAVEKSLEHDVDHAACPSCGCYQADMVSQSRRFAHWCMFWASVVVLALVLILYGSYAVTMDTLVWYAAGWCGIAALYTVAVELWNPNWNRAGNRGASERKMQRGHMRLLKEGDESASEGKAAVPARSVGSWLVLVGVIGLPVLAMSPELERLNNGWTVNPACYPPVVGPGDETRCYFADRFSSVKGYWRGVPNAVIQGEGVLGPRVVKASTNSNDWGDSISAKSSEKSSTVAPWVSIALPAEEGLANKDLECCIDLAVSYPQVDGGGRSFSVRNNRFQEKFAVHTSTTGAGAKYNLFWWQGSVLGLALAAVFALIFALFAGALRGHAYPTATFPIDENETGA